MIDAQRLLAKSFFSSAPFSPVPRDEARIWAGSTDTRDELIRIVSEVRHGHLELSHLALIYGEYGSGKTHALKFLKSFVEEQGSAISAYVVKPKVEKKASFHGLVKEVIKQMGERPLRSAAEPFVNFIKAEANRLALESLKTNGTDEVATIIQSKIKDTKRTLQEQIYSPFPELLEIFEGMVASDPAAWRYLTGKPAAASLGKYGLTSPIEDDHDALNVLAGVYQILTTRYPEIPGTPIYDAAYLFIDELEMLLDLRTEEVTSLRTGLRDLFDACPQHFCLILSATSENAALFHGLLDEAVMARITADPIHVTSHDTIEDGVAFIKDLMSNFRSDAPPTPYHPFDQDSLSAIVDRTGLPKTARKLIVNCRRVWDQNAELVIDGHTIGVEEVTSTVGLL